MSFYFIETQYFKKNHYATNITLKKGINNKELWRWAIDNKSGPWNSRKNILKLDEKELVQFINLLAVLEDWEHMIVWRQIKNILLTWSPYWREKLTIMTMLRRICKYVGWTQPEMRKTKLSGKSRYTLGFAAVWKEFILVELIKIL